MAWSGLTLTVDGRQALTDAQMSNVINFKAIVIGDGAPPTNFNTQKSLVHQLYEITDIDVEASEEGCTITGDFPIVDYDYYFKEIGLLVTTNNGDKLYVYDNCGDDAQYIVSTTGVETNRKRIRLSLIISNVAEITVSTPSILYVDYATYKKDLSKLVHNDGGDISKTISSVTEPSDDVKYPEIPSSNGVVNIILGNLTRWVKSLKLDKVDSIGGDTADTLVSAFDASSDSFPVPAAKEKARTRWGKMKKFTEDFRNWMTGVCLIGQIVNNCVTDRTDLPLSAAQGKVLMDLYTVLNTNSSKIGHAHDERYYTEAEVNNLFNTYQGLPQYSMDLFNVQSGGRLLYYDTNTKNTPYKAGITQASEGVAITVGDWGNFITSLAIPKGDSRLYIYSRANSIITDWKML